MNKLFLTLTLAAVIGVTSTSCRKKGCTDSTAINYDSDAKKDDGTCEFATDTTSGYQLTINFTHNYDGTSVTSSDFNDLKFTNAAGTTHSISKLKYLISDFRLYTAGGDSVVLDGYQFVDLTNSGSLTYSVSNYVPNDTYTGVAFNFGFDPTDNISGAYADLNVANWSWPAMLGGGYHNLQFEGQFVSNVPDTTSFAYHMGKAREITVTDTIYHDNHFLAQLSNSGFTLTNDANIEVKMNIAEWFKNPYTWDLNTYGAMLMPNFAAQMLMQDNGPSVFSVGAITQ